jgi:hypothetical protein
MIGVTRFEVRVTAEEHGIMRIYIEALATLEEMKISGNTWDAVIRAEAALQAAFAKEPIPTTTEIIQVLRERKIVL